MIWRLELTDEARDDLAVIEDYIADRADSDTAERFVGNLVSRCERLADLSGILGTARPDLAPDLRSTPHKGYVIFFRYHEDALEVVNVLDARRDALAYFSPDEED